MYVCICKCGCLCVWCIYVFKCVCVCACMYMRMYVTPLFVNVSLHVCLRMYCKQKYLLFPSR